MHWIHSVHGKRQLVHPLTCGWMIITSSLGYLGEKDVRISLSAYLSAYVELELLSVFEKFQRQKVRNFVLVGSKSKSVCVCLSLCNRRNVSYVSVFRQLAHISSQQLLSLKVQ